MTANAPLRYCAALSIGMCRKRIRLYRNGAIASGHMHPSKPLLEGKASADWAVALRQSTLADRASADWAVALRQSTLADKENADWAVALRSASGDRESADWAVALRSASGDRENADWVATIRRSASAGEENGDSGAALRPPRGEQLRVPRWIAA
jgi:hypothetical protein